MIHLSILRLSRNDESLAVLAMSDEQGSIRQEGDFLLESLPVFRKRLRQIYLILLPILLHIVLLLCILQQSLLPPGFLLLLFLSISLLLIERLNRSFAFLRNGMWL